MKFTRTASTLIAAASLAVAGGAFAATDSNYGRAGGMAKWGDHMTATQPMPAADRDTGNWYGRAGGPLPRERVTNAGMSDSSTSDSGKQPEWSGRQGRALPIDELRG